MTKRRPQSHPRAVAPAEVVSVEAMQLDSVVGAEVETQWCASREALGP